MPRFLKSLFGQVVLALPVGVAVGLFAPAFVVKLEPLGDAFIKLIKMIIPVLVFCVVVHGIAGAGDLRRVGRAAVKALIYFEAVTTIALVPGLVLAFWFQLVLGAIMRLAGFSIFKFLAYLREELAVVFATTSSDSVLPQITGKLKRMGIRDSTVGLVIPTGYS